MATYTSRLKLKKPAGTENININDINSNMDKIDAESVLRNQEKTWTSAITVTQFINECEAAMGTAKGIYFLGYINYAALQAWGLDFNGYVIGLYHNESYKSIFIVASGNNGRYGKFAKVANVWDETLYQVDDNRYRKNEVLNAYCEGFGRLTSSGTKIALSIPLPKVVPAYLTPTLQTGSRFEVRGITGYVGEFTASNSVEVVGNSAYTVACARRNGGMVLQVEITKTSGNFGVTNNTPIQVYCYPLKVSLT